MTKAQEIFEKVAISNKLIEKVFANKAYEFHAKSKQVSELADSAEALSKLPVSLWEVSGYGKKVDKLTNSLKDAEKMNKKMSRTIDTVYKQQPSFFNDSTRYIADIGAESGVHLDKVKKIVEELSAKGKEKINLINSVLKSQN